MKANTINTGENYPHRTLWLMTRRLFEDARTTEKGAQLYDATAMVLAAMTFESYINYLGFKLDPVAWQRERKWSWADRVEKAFVLCDLPVPDKNRRPYSSIWALKDFRDTLAHGKVKVIDEMVEHLVDEERPWLRGIFDGVVTSELTHLYLEDLHEQCRMMHTAAKPKAFTCIGVVQIPDIWFGDDPLEGITGYQSASTGVTS